MSGENADRRDEKSFFLSSKDSTLIMIHQGSIILESSQNTLRPLVEALSLLNRWNNLIVYDKTVGLAAAKLHSILNPKMIYADLISKEAIKFLQDNNIEYHYNKCVEVILGDEKKTCPNEILARELDAEELHAALVERFEIQTSKD